MIAPGTRDFAPGVSPISPLTSENAHGAPGFAPGSREFFAARSDMYAEDWEKIPATFHISLVGPDFSPCAPDFVAFASYFLRPCPDFVTVEPDFFTAGSDFFLP